MATWRGPSQGGRRNPGGGRNNPGGGGGGGGGGGSFSGSAGSAGSHVFSLPGGRPTPSPDPKVIQIENSLLGTKTTGLAGLGLHETLPRRPSYGTRGKPLVLWANYCALKLSPHALYQYDLSVEPKAAGKKLAHIVRLFLQLHLDDFRHEVVTDFASNLIALRKISDESFTLLYRAEGEDEPRENAREYTVTLKLTGSLDLADLVNFVTSSNLNARYDDKTSAIRALNILLNHYAKSSSQIATIGITKSFSLVNAESYDLDAGLRAIRGFFTSIRPATGRILLNVNVCHSVFYDQVSLEKSMKRFLAAKGSTLMKLGSFLKKVRVTATHLRQKRNKNGEIIVRAKAISNLATRDDGTTAKGVSLEHRPRVSQYGAGPKNVEFWLEDRGEKLPSPPKKKGGKPGATGGGTTGGRYISVYDYFKNTYNFQISDTSLPVVNVGTKENPSYLPAQACVVLPGQPARRHLSTPQIQKMIQFAVRGPADNANSIVSKGREIAGLSPNIFPQLNNFGVTVSPDLITVQGRVLQEPNVVYGGNKPARVANGSWNMVPREAPLTFSSSKPLQNWSLLNVYTNDGSSKTFAPDELVELMKTITQILRKTGVTVGPPILPPPQVELDDKKIIKWFGDYASRCKFLFVILPATPIPQYYLIKRLADVHHGVHTICSVGSKIANPRGQDQYLHNEALKVNLKLGGNNQVIQRQHLGLIAEGKTMVVGIDVTHPSPGSSESAPSISAMVANIDSNLSQWPGTLKVQAERRQEMVSHLQEMLVSRLKLWRTRGNHTVYPENIVVYRDGVSEGQYEKVLNEELPLLRAACREVYPPPDQAKGLPRISIIVVGKRHHTRFYVTNSGDADRSGNPQAGTVVDRGVTEARTWDFFLQSHAAIKGTARPAHYVVLLDEIFRGSCAKIPGKNVADELQMITQSMCYVFGRATKAVSYCTPAYYADILCERARCYLSDVYETPDNSTIGGGGQNPQSFESAVKIHPNLQDTMFYI
ncbi:hypothetical protein ANO14919_022300 [Xylariales sp. No.14919]|nr:hypothetical protein ANO14919_022300 [Xylariales sp. No.14919]